MALVPSRGRRPLDKRSSALPKKRAEPSLVIPPDGAVGRTGLPVPVLVHLSGPLRGTTVRLSGDQLRIGARPEFEVSVSPEPMVASPHAILIRQGSTYLLRAEQDCPLWVNGEPLRERLLEPGDVLEIGRDGPILRFRLYPPGTRASKTVAEAFADCIDAARLDSGSPPGRVARGIKDVARALATQTTLWFRLTIVIVVVALVVVTAVLVRRSRQFEQRLTREEMRVEGLATLLEEESTRLDLDDLQSVREELSTTRGRLEALEARTAAPARIVARASSAVVLLQGAYGFVDPGSGEPLRFLGVGPDGAPLRNARGEPIVGIGGDGPPVEAQFLGTGFVVSADGLLLTNRHVVLPWEYDAAARLVVSQGLEPRLVRLLAFLPGVGEPVTASLVDAADDADLALLSAPGVDGRLEPLELSRRRPPAGEEIIVLGYPAGIRALLARADEALVAALAEGGGVDFWEVTRRLASAGQIGPLASRGIVAQVSSTAVVYDAETTRGGSGGPVLDLSGEVLAVTSAVVTEFGGSNLAVPAARARELIARVAFERMLLLWRIR